MNTIYNFTSYVIPTYEFLNGSILEKLTPLQKKVGAIFAVIIVSLAALYAFCWYKKHTKIALKDKSEKVKLVEIDQKSIKKKIKKVLILENNPNNSKEIKIDTQINNEKEINKQLIEIKNQKSQQNKSGIITLEKMNNESQEITTIINQFSKKTAKFGIKSLIIENKWNANLYQLTQHIDDIKRVINLNLFKTLHLLIKIQEDTEEIVDYFSLDQAEQDTKIIKELQSLLKQVQSYPQQSRDPVLQLHTRYLSQLLEKRIEFLKAFHTFCGQNGQSIIDACTQMQQIIVIINQKREEVTKNCSIISQNLPQDEEAAQIWLKTYNLREKEITNLHLATKEAMEAWQAVSGNMSRVLEISKRMLDFFETLQKQGQVDIDV